MARPAFPARPILPAVRFAPAALTILLSCSHGGAQPSGRAPGRAASARPAGPTPAPLATPPAQPVEDLIQRANQAMGRKAYFAGAHFFRAAAARLGGEAAAALEFRAHQAYLAAGRVELALEALNRYCTLTRKPYGRVHGARLLRRLSRRLIGERNVRALYVRVAKDSILAGLLGPRLARAHLAAGKPAEASRILKEASAGIAAYRAFVGQGTTAKPRVMGCLMCLAGPYKRVCLSVLRGVLLAAEVFGPPAAGAPLSVAVADVSGPSGAARAVDRLAYGGRVVGIVGPVDPAAARLAAARARQLGVPILTLTPDPSVAGTASAVFQFLPKNHRRAEALTRSVMGQLGRGAPMGILAPSTPAGRSLAKSFAEHTTRLGGRPVLTVYYPAGATHFGSEIRKLKRGRVQGLLAATPARTLELLAPQLALANMWPRKPRRTTPPVGPRRRRRSWSGPAGPVVGATADGLDPARLKRMRRYVDGVFVCPGFHPDEADPHWGAFVKDFRRAYGKPPDIVAGYAFRAALRIRQVLDSGVDTRAGLARGLNGLRTSVTPSRPLFDAHGRLDRAPAVYRILNGKLTSQP